MLNVKWKCLLIFLLFCLLHSSPNIAIEGIFHERRMSTSPTIDLCLMISFDLKRLLFPAEDLTIYQWWRFYHHVITSYNLSFLPLMIDETSMENKGIEKVCRNFSLQEILLQSKTFLWWRNCFSLSIRFIFKHLQTRKHENFTFCWLDF